MCPNKYFVCVDSIGSWYFGISENIGSVSTIEFSSFYMIEHTSGPKVVGLLDFIVEF